MLQDPLLDGIITDSVNEQERKCNVSVVIILNEEMERKQRKGLTAVNNDGRNKERKGRNGKTTSCQRC